MTTYAALLRAVNLGPHNKVAMADLRDLLSRLGMENPRSLLQSGNVVFRSRLSAPKLERAIDAAVTKELGLATEVFVRSAAELADLVARNPFPEAARSDPGHLLVMFLRTAPRAANLTALRSAIKGRETVEAAGRHAYVVYPDGVGRSRLTIALLEKHLASQGTGRNWNTVLKLLAMTSAE